MKPTPEPTASTATTHPSCPPSWACDTDDAAGLNAVGIFVACVAGLLFLAWISSKKKGN